MIGYEVSWHFTSEDAPSAEEAAREAFDAFSREGSIAHVFQVTTYPAEGRITTETVDLDRGRDADIDGDPLVYPASAAERARLAQP